jgi:hypothetical protein
MGSGRDVAASGFTLVRRHWRLDSKVLADL